MHLNCSVSFQIPDNLCTLIIDHYYISTAMLWPPSFVVSVYDESHSITVETLVRMIINVHKFVGM